MSGIFLFFDPDGISPAMAQTFEARLGDRVSRMPHQKVETLRTDTLIGAASHHGVLPSGGAAERAGGSLLCTGSCWIEPDAAALATPAELLAACSERPLATRPPFHGSFALAHGDDPQARLTVESDRWAVYPLYYRRMGRGVAVSTALKFLVTPGEESVNRDALAELLSIGYVARLHTLLEGIHRLPGNARLVCDRDGVAVTHFPATRSARNRPADPDALRQYDDLVRQYLGRFKGLTDTFCISMSGGLDSRLVGAAAQREGMKLSAFTIGEPGSLDARMAGKVCRRLDIPLVTHEVDGSTFGAWFGKTVWFTEGRALPEHLHYMTANLTQATPAGPQLHGLMGEIVLGGHFDKAKLQTASPEAVRQACRDLVTPAVYWPQGAQAAVLAPDLLDRMSGIPDDIATDLFDRMGFQGTYSDFLDYKYRLKGDPYMNPCIMSQVVPWSDVVNPFSDDRAFALGASLALEDIAERGGQIKWGLQHLPVIAELPRVKAGVLIDVQDSDPDAYLRGLEKLLRKEKFRYLACRLSRGRINLPLNLSFPEYGGWYRRWKPVRDYVDGILLSEQTLDRGVLQREGLQKLLHDLRIGRNTWGAVGTCLMTEIFLRQFADGTDWPADPVTPLGLDG